MRKTIILFLATGYLATSCHTGNNLAQQKNEPGNPTKTTLMATPSVLIYKTRKDYHNNVPIILSDDKTEIVSYPDPRDLTNAAPVALSNGYWLDNRGIGKNVAFLKLTYAQYSALPQPPSLEQLNKLIIDRNPLTELYNCGNRQSYANLKEAMNKIIQTGQLDKQCKLIETEGGE